MEFFSPRFALLLGATLVSLVLIPPGNYRRLTLCLASCLFYAAWDWRYLGLLLAISGIDYWAASHLTPPRQRAHTAWLALSLATNLGALAYFKYRNFGLQVLGFEPSPAELVLPAGISFYTFKSLSYTLDVYRGKLKTCPRWSDYALFVSFFPDLIAGPLVRASIFLPQIQRDPPITRARLVVGANIFLQGLTKKILLADHLGELADPVFSNPSLFSVTSVWVGMTAFSLQIYCDFAGYSDMAIGTAHMLGYDLPMNFDRPYQSRNLVELWKRWHITLSEWIRDYCFVPLGGALATTRTRNLLLVMLLVGLWHGPGWHFVFWGLLQGLALAFLHQTKRQRWRPWPRPLAWAVTFLFWTLGGILFRSPDLLITLQFGLRLVAWPQAAGLEIFYEWFVISIALLWMGHWICAQVEQGQPAWLGWFGLKTVDLPLAGRYLCFVNPGFWGSLLLTLWLGLLFTFCAASSTPFIYFAF
ncbi:MBOAT family protein [bacterium]|nr:MBOAT family protein [bacterium]